MGIPALRNKKHSHTDIIAYFLSQALSAMSMVCFGEEEEVDFVPNLFGLHPVDDWVDGRRDGYIETAKQCMERVGDIVTKTVGQCREYGWCIE